MQRDVGIAEQQMVGKHGREGKCRKSRCSVEHFRQEIAALRSVLLYVYLKVVCIVTCYVGMLHGSQNVWFPIINCCCCE